MILEQYYLGCLSQASYLIADETSKVAAVVDPRRDVDLYLEEAARLGVTIKHVLLTHFHADFLAGHLELQQRTGAVIHLGAQGKAEYDVEPRSDGDTIALGEGLDGVTLKILETPGHTPESISIVVYPTASGDPHAVLTGDTLFIGDVGRPDLLASLGFTAPQLAEMLYDSLHEKLMKLPDATLLYPGHGAGSSCGKALSSVTVCTIGRQRQANYALQPMDRAEFVEKVASGQPVMPAYFAIDALLNRQKRPLLEESLANSLKPLALDEVLRLQNQGAQVLDVDSAEAFGRGHLAGSVNVGFDGRYASWAGSVLDPKAPIVLVTPVGQEEQAAVRLGRIGYDHVVGYLEGGKAAIDGRADLLTTVRRFDVSGLREILAASDAPQVLDVRTPGEREASAIEGSLHIPLNQLNARLDELPRDGPLVVVCGGGYRSMIAASLLARAGIETSDLEGGMNAWLEG